MSVQCTVLNTKPHISINLTWGIDAFLTVYFLLTSPTRDFLYVFFEYYSTVTDFAKLRGLSIFTPLWRAT